MSFSLWAMACRGISGAFRNKKPDPSANSNRAGCILQSTDESGAQVALLQSPILQTAPRMEHKIAPPVISGLQLDVELI